VEIFISKFFFSRNFEWFWNINFHCERGLIILLGKIAIFGLLGIGLVNYLKINLRKQLFKNKYLSFKFLSINRASAFLSLSLNSPALGGYIQSSRLICSALNLARPDPIIQQHGCIVLSFKLPGTNLLPKVTPVLVYMSYKHTSCDWIICLLLLLLFIIIISNGDVSLQRWSESVNRGR